MPSVAFARRGSGVSGVAKTLTISGWVTSQNRCLELYSRMEFETDRRLDEANRVGVGFTVPPANCSKCSKNFEAEAVEVAA